MALRSDDDSVGWVHDRLVLLVPADAVVLVMNAAEQLDDLSASGWLAVHTALRSSRSRVRYVSSLMPW
jgi:hypothetical protein